MATEMTTISVSKAMAKNLKMITTKLDQGTANETIRWLISGNKVAMRALGDYTHVT